MRGSALFDDVPDALADGRDAARDCDAVGVETAVQGHFRLIQSLIRKSGELADAIHARAMAMAASPESAVADLNALAQSFDRAVRSVRQTVLLQDRIITSLEVQGRRAASQVRENDARQGLARERRLRARHARVELTVERVARAQHRDDVVVERLVAETREQLRGDRFGDLLNRPISEAIALICQDLHLTPDWPRLAEEDWAQEELRLKRPPASVRPDESRPPGRAIAGGPPVETPAASPLAATRVPTSIGIGERRPL